MDLRLQHRQRDAHVRGVSGDAMLARPEDRVHAVDAVDRRTAATRLALIARCDRVVEVQAARALQEIAPGRGHVAQLLRGPGEDRAGEQRIARLDLRVIGEIAIGHQRADPQATVPGLLDLVERQMRDVDQLRGARDILLDEVDQIGAAGDEFRGRVRCDLAHGVGDVARARIAEVVHRPASPDCLRSLAEHHLLDGGHDVGIRAATADVAAHQLADFVGRARPALGDQAGGGTDLAGGAVAALEGVMVDEGLLQRMKRAALRQTLDRRDLRAILHDRQREA